MRRFVLVSAALLGAGAVVFSACSSGDGGATGRAEGVTGVPDGAPFVDQDNLSFRPRQVIVQVGETVYFKNSESALHTITLDNKNLSGPMARNDVFQWTPPGTGTYAFTCDYHPQMKTSVEVVETLPEGTAPSGG